jgi:FixJ family two-component response regulator
MKPEGRVIGIVDDNPDVRDALADLLSTFGYRTETFGSAQEFLAAARTTEAECLVIDIHLGDVSGLELALRLKEAGCRLPVIFITVSSSDDLRRQALDIGCAAYINKFALVDRLALEVKRALVP